MTLHNAVPSKSSTRDETPQVLAEPLPGRGWLFGALWLFIILVSVIDGYLVLVYRREIWFTELNPQGRVLLALSGGRVWSLLAVKFIGTVLACAVLLLIYGSNQRLGTIIAAVLAVFQLGLLLFLTCV